MKSVNKGVTPIARGNALTCVEDNIAKVENLYSSSRFLIFSVNISVTC